MGTVKITVSDGVCYAVSDHNPNASEAVVCLHGFTGSKDSWTFLDAMFPESRLVKIDCLGHGETDAPIDGRRYSTSRQVSDLAETFNQLKLHKVKLIGYSMGGRLAYSFAVTFPERVAALVLESTTPGLRTLEERKARIMKDRKLADSILRDGIVSFVNYWESIPLFSSQRLLDESKRDVIRRGRLQNSPIGLANSLTGMGTGSQPSWWDKLEQITAPVLLICGEWDEKFCGINKKVHERLSYSKIKIVKQAGHTVHVEQPRFFGKIVSEFLSSEKA
ncbi:2-succinyl-6-hydroxy-2,4-cyclohexadiene-1-carboxylate synthase [Bacillus atrophaeus]|uniref:2-succinyl-6-hydroxy-2, 4-cyclohexadiene-1-carboxylate synthase n=1 Tax=Bacillus atrophaeus TaxID=1452 RepID=UPI002DBAF715|nr:2-succinyl-6-hydroxy-2,4-cyclohexadiene-1-carboxylate synthase [Bacillus atrophaeus]MEC2306743.1 2-succinyl-6-hydroxy-2,4-cyclohexadiene-1-carboxylate synthase [Bacillus atrophaeus]